MKHCVRCQKTKPFDDFTRSKSRKDGLNPYCRECTRAASKVAHAKDPSKAAARGAAWYAANKDRHAARTKQWFADNPGKAAEYCRRWKEKDPDAARALLREWYAKNRDKELAADKLRREVNLEKYLLRERASYAKRRERKAETNRVWRAGNTERVAWYTSNRRSRLAERTPPWLTDEHFVAMLDVFTLAALLTAETGELHHVDHIVPLKGKTVSGLNVPWNLQAIPAIENLRKSNKHAA